MRRFVPLVLLLGCATPLRGDWIVLRSGERIATKGAWKERGRSIVYTALADGQLVSLPTADVDVVASLKASSNEATTLESYKDLGNAPDANQLTFAPEMNGLLDWIRDPNAPRVSGTVSAPTLRVPLEELIEEGRRMIADPNGTVASLAIDARQINENYSNCSKLARDDFERKGCDEQRTAAVTATRDRIEQAREAIQAARDEEKRQAKAAEAEAKSQAAARRGRGKKAAGEDVDSPPADDPPPGD